MKLKHKILAYSMVPALLGLGFLGVNSVSANGFFGGIGGNLTPDQIASRQLTMFQTEAELLGLSIDEVKEAWATGKNFAQLAKDKGVTQTQLRQKMKEARTAQIKNQLKALVDKGVITQAQADKRLATIEKAQTNAKGGRMGKHGRGMGWMGF